jgi:dihydrofolate reductase
MKLSLIVAVSENQVIGKDNDLVWHLPADMKYFKEKTTGHCIITGRKNYESIPAKFRPLPNRTNIVITRQKDYQAPGAIITDSLEKAVALSQELEKEETFIIGGGEIFKQSIKLVEKIYLTRVHAPFEGDVFFPELNYNEWKESFRQDCIADDKNPHPYSFIVLERAI